MGRRAAMSGDAAHRADFTVYVQHQRGVIVYQTGAQRRRTGGDQRTFIDGGAAAVVVVAGEDQSACAFFGQRFTVPSATRIQRVINVCQCSRNVKAAVRVAQGKGAVGVGSGVVSVRIPGEGGRQVIVGVVCFIDFSVDSQEVNIFSIHSRDGQIVEITRNGAVAVNQRVSVCLRRPTVCNAADAGNIQRAAQRDAVGDNGAFTVGLTEVNIQRTIGLLSQRVDVERRTFGQLSRCSRLGRDIRKVEFALRVQLQRTRVIDITAAQRVNVGSNQHTVVNGGATGVTVIAA